MSKNDFDIFIYPKIIFFTCLVHLFECVYINALHHVPKINNQRFLDVKKWFLMFSYIQKCFYLRTVPSSLIRVCIHKSTTLCPKNKPPKNFGSQKWFWNFYSSENVFISVVQLFESVYMNALHHVPKINHQRFLDVKKWFRYFYSFKSGFIYVPQWFTYLSLYTWMHYIMSQK